MDHLPIRRPGPGDPQDRTEPNNVQTSTAYHGLSVTVTDANNHATTTMRNAQGLIASVTDALPHTTSYVYDAFGDLVSTTDPAGNVVSNVFDPKNRSWSATRLGEVRFFAFWLHQMSARRGGARSGRPFRKPWKARDWIARHFMLTSTAPHFRPDLARTPRPLRAPWRLARPVHANWSHGLSSAARAACASRWRGHPPSAPPVIVRRR